MIHLNGVRECKQKTSIWSLLLAPFVPLSAPAPPNSTLCVPPDEGLPTEN